MMKQRVDQCAVGMASSGVDDQACGFVDDDQMRVFKDDIQRNILRLRLVGPRRGNIEAKGAPFEFFAGGIMHRLPVDQQGVVDKQCLNTRAR